MFVSLSLSIFLSLSPPSCCLSFFLCMTLGATCCCVCIICARVCVCTAMCMLRERSTNQPINHSMNPAVYLSSCPSVCTCIHTYVQSSTSISFCMYTGIFFYIDVCVSLDICV